MSNTIVLYYSALQASEVHGLLADFLSLNSVIRFFFPFFNFSNINVFHYLILPFRYFLEKPPFNTTSDIRITCSNRRRLCAHIPAYSTFTMQVHDFEICSLSHNLAHHIFFLIGSSPIIPDSLYNFFLSAQFAQHCVPYQVLCTGISVARDSFLDLKKLCNFLTVLLPFVILIVISKSSLFLFVKVTSRYSQLYIFQI